MIWALILQAIITFDPYSVKTIEYLPKDAVHLEDGRIAFRQVLLTFNKMIVLAPGERIEDKVTGQAPVMHPDAETGKFAYKPKDCKPLHDARMHYVCVDRHWGKEPPAIYWTPNKKQSDPLPVRKEPLV